MAKYEETPEFLAVAGILRSKRRAAVFLKSMRGTEYEKLIQAAKDYKKELQEKSRAMRTVANEPGADEIQERREMLFVMRTMAMAGLPHSPFEGSELTRRIRLGASSWVDMTLTVREHNKGHRLPFGVNARRVFIMLCTMAVEQGNPIITLDNAILFMKKMGWKLSPKGVIGGDRYKELRNILESFQKMTIDLKYRGVFGRNTKTDDAFSVIRRFHMPNKDEDQALISGATPLYGLNEAMDEEESNPPGVFWVRLDPLFHEELVGAPAKDKPGSAFPFTPNYLLHFKTSKEIDVALFIAARCSAAEYRSKVDLHDIWNQLGIDPSNYSMFKACFAKTLEKVKGAWDGCSAALEGHTAIFDPVQPGKELVARSLADTLLADFLSRKQPAGYIEGKVMA